MKPKRMGHPSCDGISLDMYHGLRTDGRKIGLLAVKSADFDEGVVFPVDEGGELAVAAEEVSGVDVDELEDSWVELHLEGHGEDVASVAEHDGYLEGAADGLVGGGRNNAKADGWAAGNGCRCRG